MGSCRDTCGINMDKTTKVKRLISGKVGGFKVLFWTFYLPKFGEDELVLTNIFSKPVKMTWRKENLGPSHH